MSGNSGDDFDMRQGPPGHWQDDKWVLDKHPFVAGMHNRCTKCGQPESNANHPPLPEEAPVPIRQSLDDQMADAIGEMAKLTIDVRRRPRQEWTRAEWVAEAEEIMDDIHGSVVSLINGHVTALISEVHDLRRRNQSMQALRTVDLRTILRLTPVVDATQKWVAADSTPDAVKAIAAMENAVRDYNAILAAEEEKETQGEKNDRD